MSEYTYETHLHTAEVSKCGHSKAKEFVGFFKSLGYTGIFITDHFNGNSHAADIDCWEERIKLFCRGYENAAAEGDKMGLDVFFGWEYGSGGAHYLTYGLGKDWLLNNPDMLSWDTLEYLDRIHEAGGYIVHAHPFREGVEQVQLTPYKIDAVEVLNANRPEESNQHAFDFAESFGLPKTAGSDIHSVSAENLAVVVSDRRLTSGRDYMKALIDGEVSLIEQGAVCAM